MSQTRRCLMESPRISMPIVLGIALLLAPEGEALAQTATVTLSSQKQYIRGFGGMSHAAWAGDLTAAERTLAFGNADGQLGFSALRIPVSDGSPDSSNVATAKAAIANGAIVLATPWNSSGAMDSSEFASYATHLNDFITYMQGQGVTLYAIGVQNEPDYGSQGGWRSWTAAQCHDFVLSYGATITGAKLMSCESYSYNKSYYDPILNDSAALANVQVFGTHLYGTPVSSYAYPLFDTNGTGKERWMTEHYTDSTTDANSWPNALGVATELHNAMVTGQFNLYTWWYIVRSYGPISSDGTVSKRGYCMGHWSKFVRPGFYRVDATAAPASNVLLSAYKSDTAVVIIIVNNNTAASSLSITVDGSTISSYAKYTTSGSKSLASDGTVTASAGSLSVSLDSQSVTTLYGTNGSTGAAGSPGSGGATGSGTIAGSGGVTGADAGSDAREVGGAAGAPATGGVVATGGGVAGTGGSLTGGNGGAGQVGGGSFASGGSQTNTGSAQTATGGVQTSTGGSRTTAGGASATTVGGSPPVTGGVSGASGAVSGAGSANGCSCQITRSGRRPALVVLLVFSALVRLRRLSFARSSSAGPIRRR